MKNILDFFPHDKPRTSQITALDWLVEQDAKYLLLEAPVGIGKSALALCYSKYLNQPRGKSYILTPQRVLQEQYIRSFDNNIIAGLYGKSNYPCYEKNTTCDIGSIFKKQKCASCPYSNAFHTAKEIPNLVLNYKLALTLFGYTKAFDSESQVRNVMVLDECHSVEEFLTDFGAPTIYKKRAFEFKAQWPDVKKLTLMRAVNWLQDEYLPKADKHLLKLQHEAEPLLQVDPEELTSDEMKLVRRYVKLGEHIAEYGRFVLQDIDDIAERYVLIYDQQGFGSFRFKQITGARNFKWLLEPHADRFLFMSSTILNKEGFCSDLGLPTEDTAFMSLGSEFPKENRQVFYVPHTKMTANWNSPERTNDRLHMLEGIKKLLEMHKDENGIIHTANFKISQWLIEELERWPQASHEFIHHNPNSGDDRNAIIKHFQSTNVPSVLISPSITEGLDLYDDIARFAIFAKISFPYLGDQWIKRRLAMSQEWYNRQTMISVIQGGGRIVRSKDDWGTVYILDESFGRLYGQMYHSIPEWWKDSYSKI